ncbi:hypothetical protein HY745_00580 [Candidatus Desantisbacteria bacterium]|nr:hypothetical protein [Candidatus Desantisbacteria bacterium]
MTKLPNSQYLTWFNEIEKILWSFYKHFENLCSECALYTISSVKNSSRENRFNWCCCMIDNQVNDNWETLNNVQSRFDNNWYEKIKKNSFDLGRNRMPGNGPCPALGPSGCLLTKLRPVTCTTQLCEKMLIILQRLKIIPGFKSVPLQIEDIVPLKNILPILYGYHKDKKVKLEEKLEYIKAIKELTTRFGSIDRQIRKNIINEVILEFKK